MMICPECDAQNPPSEEICGQCAFPLEASAPATPEKQCPNCDQAVATDLKFCDGCGTNLDPNSTPTANEPDLAGDTAIHVAPPTAPPPPAAPTAAATPPPVPQATTASSWKLKVIEGFSLGKEYLLYKQEMVVGRPDEEVQMFPDIDLEDQDDGFVSRRHAKLEIKDGLVSIEDFGGENGTLVNGRRIPPHKPINLNSGEVIRVGKVGLMLLAHD